MKELTDLKSKAALWWKQRQTLLLSYAKDPLTGLLGLRLSRRGEGAWALKLPWSRPQRLLCDHVPQSFLVAMAEKAFHLQADQAKMLFPFDYFIAGVEAECYRHLKEPVEVRFQTEWPELEKLRLELAKETFLEKTFSYSFWSGDERSVGSVKLRIRLIQRSYLSA